MAKIFASAEKFRLTEGARLARLRLVVGAFYFMQGLVSGSWASRIPDVKNALGLSESALGLALFMIPFGQLVSMPFAGRLTARFGSRVCAAAAVMLYGSTLTLTALAAAVGTRAAFFAALVVYGVSGNLHNIAVNTQGVGVERLYGRSIMASFHGVWSLAGFTAGLLGSLLVARGVSPTEHFAGVYAGCVVVMIFLIRFTISSDAAKRKTVRELRGNAETDAADAAGTPDARAPRERRKSALRDPFIVLLGVICFVNMGCEGVMFDWSGVYFQQVVRPEENLVRLGYTAALGAMALGRFVADRFVMRFGQVRVIRACALVSACGLALSVAFPSLVPATLGFALVGFGISSIVPVCYSLSARAEGVPAGVAIAAVSTIGFLGFLLGPPVIGYTAEFLGNAFARTPESAASVGLRGAFLCAAVFALLSFALAPHLKKFVRPAESFSGKA